MATRGGSAAINGFLYQIIGSLHWAAYIALKSRLEGGELVEAQLILEPHKGGDIQVQGHRRRIVEQWKTGGPTWSVRQVIDEVVPNLYLAVLDDDLEAECEYVFVTEGRKGNWRNVDEFLQKMTALPIPPDPLGLLDATRRIAFFANAKHTEREFFLTVADRVRHSQQANSKSDQLLFRKLWHLLGRFRIKQALSAKRLEREIDQFLLAIVDFREDVVAKRRELVGYLFEMAAQGEARLDTKDIFKRAGLTATSLIDWVNLKQNLIERLNRILAREGYSASADVRQPRDWSPRSPVLMLSGESGQGKTWGLARFASDAAARGDVVLWIKATGDADKDLQKAANIIWQDILNRDQPLAIDRIRNRLKAILPGLPECWLILCIDDVQSVREANQLLDTDWTTWGIELAVTVPPNIAKAAQIRARDCLNVIQISDFTTNELRILLKRHGFEWGDVPSDLRGLLKRPLTAKLFTKISSPGSGYLPTNEYSLLELFWDRIQNARDQADFPLESTRMRSLTNEVLKADTAYPWTADVLRSLNFDDQTCRRLEIIGWLRSLPDGRFEIPHDRLLNWAAAECLVEQRQPRRINSVELGARLVECSRPLSTFAGKSLGYVPMDVLWLASDSHRGLRNEVPELILALENDQAYGAYPQQLFEHLLPTLGDRFIPSASRIIELTSTREFNPYPELVATSLLNMVGASDAVQELSLNLLHNELPAAQSTALRLLAARPSALALNRLWHIHKQNSRALAGQEERNRYRSYELSFTALRMCIQRDPAWLSERIQKVSIDEPSWELAYQLADLDHPKAEVIWRENKALLFAAVPHHKPRALIRCIRTFKDVGELRRLEEWAQESEDWANMYAFAALALLDPDRALALLDAPDHHMYMSRNWWLPELLLRRHNATWTKVRSLLCDPAVDSHWVTLMLQDHANDVDPETLDLLIDDLNGQLARGVDKSKPGAPYHLAELLAKMYRPDLLDRFESRAGSEVEIRLCDLARSSITDEETPGIDFSHNGRLILLKIGGRGITSLINAGLATADCRARRFFLKQCLYRPDENTLQYLNMILMQQVENADSLELELAAYALTHLRHDETVIDAILGGAIWPSDRLLKLRQERAPVSVSDMTAVTSNLDDTDETVRTRAVLVIAFSGNKEFLPKVRQMLAQVTPGNQLALALYLTLRALGDTNSETVEVLRQHLDSGGNREMIINLLLGINTERALVEIMSYLSEIPDGQFGKWELKVTAHMALLQLQRAAAISMLQARLKEVPKQDWPIECIELLGELNDDDLAEALWDEAFKPLESGIVDGRFEAAVIALSALDPNSAFQAVQQVFMNAKYGRESLPSLIMKLDPSRAVPVLCQRAIEESKTIVRWAIGRALRRSSEKALARDHIRKLLTSQEQIARSVGAELAGWLDDELDDLLVKKAHEDLHEEVRKNAASALRARRNRSDVLELMKRFHSANEPQRWRLLEAILQLADPILLRSVDDPIWIAQILRDSSWAFAHYAHDRIENRIEEIKTIAEKIDRDRV
ncbi:MAG TPA: hypothetical protein VGL91_10815 [Acidobacteriota bacterium]